MSTDGQGLKLRRLAVAAFVGALAAAPVHAAGGSAGALLALEPSRQTIEPGTTGRLTIRLLDRHGRPVAADTATAVVLQGTEGLTAADRVEIPAGESRREVDIAPRQPGGWTVRALASGWESAQARVLAPAPQPTLALRSVTPALERHVEMTEAARPDAPVSHEASRARPPEARPEGRDPRVLPEARVSETTRRAAEEAVAPAPAEPARPPSGGETLIRVPSDLSALQVRDVVEGLADPAYDRAAAGSGRAPGMAALRSGLLDALGRGGGKPVRLLGYEGDARAYNLIGLPGISGASRVVAGIGAPPAEETTLIYGEVRLFAEPERPVRPAAGRWMPVKLFAEWWDGDGEELRPARRTTDLEVRFRLDSPAELAPRPLVLPAGEVAATASLSSERPQTVKLWASWEGAAGYRGPLEIQFLAPGADRLQFDALPEHVQGLGPIRRTARVRLVDDTGRRVRAESPLDVRVYWHSEQVPDDESAAGTIPKGEEGVDLEIGLADAGTYRIVAEAAGVGQAEAILHYAMAWWLLLVAAAGGILGAAVTQIFGKTTRWARALVLGVVAGALATVLFHFGLLGRLKGVIPLAGALHESVPRTVLGIVTVSLLAGLAFEAVIGFFVRRRPGTDAGAASVGG